MQCKNNTTDADNSDVELAELLKYLSSVWRIFQVLLIYNFGFFI